MVKVGEGQITYMVENMTKVKPYFMNLVKDLSWLNSKNMEHTTRDGHVYGYLCDIDIVCKEAVNFLLMAAPNTWKMRNSFRKFHAYRKDMFRRAGVDKEEMGRYGQTIRPFLSHDMVRVLYPDPGLPQTPEFFEDDVLVPLGCTDAEREWTYTTLANEVAFSEGTDASTGLGTDVNTWALTILEENQVNASSGSNVQWSTVGMIHSYNLDRMEIITPGPDETIEGPANPLASLRFQSAASGEVIDIAEDQELEAPPYDIRDAGDSIQAIPVEYGNTNTDTLQVIRLRNVFAPAGLLSIVQGTDDTLTEDPVIMVNVKAIVECRDWT